ncbi:GH92 family glycosyl hydrolase [Sporolactobacillus kofuensis]|uniref:GH92 family glycosyl hydrolase n=1 Tax=Sporolactobacillus kofuensis TaxID=269672 RepID=A0ABW1WFH5_9BACL|nr:GH92 family glycosyl hydrolase [Sporolactobacillus kofuensis]MCO7175336.1 GH92 family glycosyl hydrolase [Sporolactobacillus kofuensis]
MDLKIFTKIVISCISLCLVTSSLPGPMMHGADAKNNSPLFFTSFEKGDPALSWKNQNEQSGKGKLMTEGITPLNGKGKTMTTLVTKGPENLYNASKKNGWTGSHVLTYSGKVTGNADSYAFNKLFNVNIKVSANTELSYLIAPESTKTDPQAEAASYVSVDLAFSDGSYLHDLKKVNDQDGFGITPKDQGKSDTLLMNQWNQKIISLGAAAKGKTIKRIIIAYKAPRANVSFKGALDDIRIDNHPSLTTDRTPVDQVNIFRGTASGKAFARGNTSPAIGVPNGFTYWAPAINSSAKAHIYPYNQNNDPNNLPEIQSFSLSQSANDQAGIQQSFQVMPSDFSGTPSANRLGRGAAFKRSDEFSSPYRYQVTFANGMKTELAATSHAAIMRYSFIGTNGNLIFDNLNRHGSLTLHPETQSLEGYTDSKDASTGNDNRLFFYAEVDQPVSDYGRLSGQGRDQSTAFFKFDTTDKKNVTLRIASSLISVAQAKKNLNQEIGKHTSLKDVENKAKKEWNKRLERVTVEGGAAQQSTLYSNLYRLYLSPNIGYENTGSKKKPDYRYADLSVPASTANTSEHTGAPIKKGQIYVNSNFSYSAQTAWPIYALLEPKLTGKMINGFLTAYKNDGVFDPDAGPAFADAVVKGVPGVHSSVLYQAMLQSSSVPQEHDDDTFTGYLSSKQKDSVSRTLSQSITDYSLGNFANYLAQRHPNNTQYADDSRYYLRQSQNYLYLFNHKRDSFTERNKDGKWAASDGSNPSLKNKTLDDWAYAFNVPQDGQGLANLYGGQDALTRKLDQFFRNPPQDKAFSSLQKHARIAYSGHLGMFTLDQAASPSQPYMYLFASAPWKTQSTLRAIMNRFYTGGMIGQGYLGSDNGAILSGFYLFGALGIYPLQKGTPDYVIGAPYFKRMAVHLENGHTLIINAPNVSNKNNYVQQVAFNGQMVNATTISAAQLANGGTLTFIMGADPSSWGTSSDALPDSQTAQSTDGSEFYPEPLADLTGYASQITSHASQSLRRLTDNNSVTAAKFHSDHPSVTLQFDSENRRVEMYTLTSSNKSKTSDPKDWTLWGSDDGMNWDLIDRRTDQSFKWRAMTRAFSIKNPQAYGYYKLTVTKKSNEDPLAISEWQLLGYSGIRSGFEHMQNEIIHQFKLKNLSESETTALSDKLNQAQIAYLNGNLSSSVYYMQSYVQVINSFIYQATASQKVRQGLTADAHAIINLMTD